MAGTHGTERPTTAMKSRGVVQMPGGKQGVHQSELHRPGTRREKARRRRRKGSGR